MRVIFFIVLLSGLALSKHVEEIKKGLQNVTEKDLITSVDPYSKEIEENTTKYVDKNSSNSEMEGIITVSATLDSSSIEIERKALELNTKDNISNKFEGVTESVPKNSIKSNMEGVTMDSASITEKKVTVSIIENEKETSESTSKDFSEIDKSTTKSNTIDTNKIEGLTTELVNKLSGASDVSSKSPIEDSSSIEEMEPSTDESQSASVESGEDQHPVSYTNEDYENYFFSEVFRGPRFHKILRVVPIHFGTETVNIKTNKSSTKTVQHKENRMM